MLYIGAENWPFPVPLVATDGQWRFDSNSGSQAIAAREIGENETTALHVCQAATNQSSPTDDKTTEREAPILNFAQTLLADNPSATSETFHGYDFRVVKQSSGRALVVAYPAGYGSSGVMTFVVRRHSVHEKDLGPQTATLAANIQGKPAGKWSKVH